MLYEQFHLLGYSLACLVLIALWFTFPRMLLNKVMQQRQQQDLN